MSKTELIRVEDLLRLADPAIKKSPAYREYFCELVARCPRCNTEGELLAEESREKRLKREISEGLAQFLLLNDVDPNEVRVVVSYPEMQAMITLDLGGRNEQISVRLHGRA